MEVIVRIIKANPWTGLTKWSTCYDYISSYWTDLVTFILD